MIFFLQMDPNHGAQDQTALPQNGYLFSAFCYIQHIYCVCMQLYVCT